MLTVFSYRRRARACPDVAGFSLVELMISMAIGLVIIGALVALFVSTSRNNREMATANSVIENGRFAIQILESDVVHAGYWSTHVPQFDDQTSREAPTDFPSVVPDPCRSFATWDDVYVEALIGIPVQVYSKDAFLDGTTCDDLVGVLPVDPDDLQPDSDVLVVRHVDTCVPGAEGCEEVPGLAYFQATLCAVPTCASPPDMQPFVFASLPAAQADRDTLFNLRQRNLVTGAVTPAVKRRYVSSIYYVRRFATAEGDEIRTLVRSEFGLDDSGTLRHLRVEPLIEGVEALRVELGVDGVSQTLATLQISDYTVPVEWQDPESRTVASNRGDGTPDGPFMLCSSVDDPDYPCFDNADPAADALHAFRLAHVTAIRIHVLARSRDATRGYTDDKVYVLGNTEPNLGPYEDGEEGFKRHVYSTTVRLVNVAGRRLRP